MKYEEKKIKNFHLNIQNDLKRRKLPDYYLKDQWIGKGYSIQFWGTTRVQLDTTFVFSRVE